jgi:hypothetical protein
MSTPRYRKVTLDLRAARFAVNAGRACWRKYDLGVTAVSQMVTLSGEGILAINTTEHPAPLDTPDDDDTLMIDLEQLSGEFEAMGRLENGYSL